MDTYTFSLPLSKHKWQLSEIRLTLYVRTQWYSNVSVWSLCLKWLCLFFVNVGLWIPNKQAKVFYRQNHGHRTFEWGLKIALKNVSILQSSFNPYVDHHTMSKGISAYHRFLSPYFSNTRLLWMEWHKQRSVWLEQRSWRNAIFQHRTHCWSHTW